MSLVSFGFPKALVGHLALFVFDSHSLQYDFANTNVMLGYFDCVWTKLSAPTDLPNKFASSHLFVLDNFNQ